MIDLKKPVIERELVVVGAGVSGLTLATEMQNQGWSVAVLDKARGSGGRMSSKRVTVNDETGEYISFDLGCSGFSAYTQAFIEQVNVWMEQGHVENISRNKQPRYTSVPRSSSITRSMADRISTRFQTKVAKIAKVNDRWHCFERLPDGELLLVSVSNYLVLSIPPAQAAELLDESSPQKSQLESVAIDAQWVAMFTLDEKVDLSFSKNELSKHGISEIQCESEKPGRVVIDGMNVWVVHMNSDWTQERLNLEKSDIRDLVANTLEQLVGERIQAKDSFCHRWLYAQVKEPLRAVNGVLKLDECLYACGDWIVDASNEGSASLQGVERAYLSAVTLSKRLLLSEPFESLKCS